MPEADVRAALGILYGVPEGEPLPFAVAVEVTDTGLAAALDRAWATCRNAFLIDAAAHRLGLARCNGAVVPTNVSRLERWGNRVRWAFTCEGHTLRVGWSGNDSPDECDVARANWIFEPEATP